LKTQGKKLTAKQKTFIAEYQKDYNATRAVIAAGYSEKTASEIAYDLLQKNSVKNVIAIQTEQRLKKIGVHAEKALSARAAVAYCDARKFFTPNGTVKSPDEWDDEMAGCVAGFEVTELFAGKNGDRQLIGYVKKVKLNDRNPAQHDITDHLRLFPERQSGTEINVQGDLNLTNMELSSKAVFLITTAMERMKSAGQEVESDLLEENDEKLLDNP
jgi:phage terminase small subunit